MHFTIDREIKLHWNTITKNNLKWVQLRGKTRYRGKETKNVLIIIHSDIIAYWKNLWCQISFRIIKLKNTGHNYVLEAWEIWVFACKIKEWGMKLKGQEQMKGNIKFRSNCYFHKVSHITIQIGAIA